MTWEVPCPQCGKRWLLRAEAKGRRLDCPQCRAPLPLGGEDAGAAADEDGAPAAMPEADTSGRAAVITATAVDAAVAPPPAHFPVSADAPLPLDEVEEVPLPPPPQPSVPPPAADAPPKDDELSLSD